MNAKVARAKVEGYKEYLRLNDNPHIRNDKKLAEMVGLLDELTAPKPEPKKPEAKKSEKKKEEKKPAKAKTSKPK
jgi:hypothetical protein